MRPWVLNAKIPDPNDYKWELYKITENYCQANDLAQATAQEARQHCRDNLGRHEVPRKVHLVPQLPKNLGGKVLKRELRKSGEYERGMDSRGT